MTSPLGRRIEPAVSTIGRLKRRPDFLAAAGGRRFHTELMSAQGRMREAASGTPLADAPPIGGLRIGFTITKRVGHATERNRIRRRLRDAVARASADLPDTSADIVLIARRPALHAPFETLIADLRRSVGAVIKPGGTKGRESAPSSRGRRRSGKPDAGKPGSGSDGIASSKTASLALMSARSPARNEAGTMPPASGDACLPSPPPNTRDGSLDG
ncbi:MULTISPECIES: ribonuclease P protein component [Methylobacterium]|nr:MULTISPECIES: ribonuclease P protein component [Methylobacterium]MBD8904321.1 ribonuclease P protein component [Methylobacterium bullatum]TXN20136.1 ribonuclease P protein component [Methylobacterium sp. WL19]